MNRLIKQLAVQMLLLGIGSLAAVFGQDLGDQMLVQDRIDKLEAEVEALRAITTGGVVPATGVPSDSQTTWLDCLSPAANAPATVYPKARLIGFFQVDGGWVTQSEKNRIAVGDIQDGGDFRRARLGAVGDVADNVGYSIEFDFAFPGRPSFMDVWLEVRDTHWLGDVKIGHFRQPIGLGGLTSVKELTFLERGLPFAFLPFRQLGAMTSGAEEDLGVTWALSGFRFPTDVFGAQIGDNGGYGMATRLTGLLLDNGSGDVLHLGGAYSLIDPANDLVRYRSQPEVFTAETGGAAFFPPGLLLALPPFVDTGPIATNTSNLLSAEIAATSGSFHGEAEMIHTMVNRIGASSVDFTGFTMQGAYILTGEHRPYNRKAGVLGGITPRSPFGKCGIGAWEIAARWSLLDLDDDDVRGGRLYDVTLGINWYLNQFSKFQFNYIHADLDSPVNGNSSADFAVFRAQVVF